MNVGQSVLVSAVGFAAEIWHGQQILTAAVVAQHVDCINVGSTATYLL